MENLPTVCLVTADTELREERDLVSAAVKYFRFPLVCAEPPSAASQPSESDTSLKCVRDADILVLIIGHRYGELMPGRRVSFVEAAYEEVVREGKEILVYMVDDDPGRGCLPMEEDPARATKLIEFKNHLCTQHRVGRFDQAANLRDTVLSDLWAKVDEQRAAIPQSAGPSQLTILMAGEPVGSTFAREWIPRFHSDPWVVLSDWDSFCHSEEGVLVETAFVDEPPDLPKLLRDARDRIAGLVPDEKDMKSPIPEFNGPRYYLRKIVEEGRRLGEQPICWLEFGPSNYRTFLVTNGMEARWAYSAGLWDEWHGTEEWVTRWRGSIFFENSFGVNVLITAVGPDGQRYALFCERGGASAVRSYTTVGSADEGLRRAYGAKLFDQKSRTDPAPDIFRAALRGAKEEVNICLDPARDPQPVLLSVGRVRSLSQPAALFHWRLDRTVEEVRQCWETARDRHLEFKKAHFVRFSKEAIVNFVRDQEAEAPVESWVILLALYALREHAAR